MNEATPRERRLSARAGWVAALLAATSGLGAAVWAGGPAASVTHLKRLGQAWFEVRQGAGGAEVIGAAAAPAGPPAPGAGSSGLFQPFVAYATGSWPEAVAIGDVSGDGRNDVVMVTSFYFDDSNDFKLFVFRQLPDGTLAPARLDTMGSSVERPETVAIGDVNGDARADVVIGNRGQGVGAPGHIGVFHQNASGGLDPVVLHPTVDSKCVRVADLNNDGRFDVVGTGWGTNSVSVWLQQPNGSLAPPAEYIVLHGGFEDLEVGDLNGDGLTDVVVANWSGSPAQAASILYQQVDGTLGGVVSRSVPGNWLPWGIGIADLNGDGRNDLALSHGGNRPDSFVSVFLQNADGTLPATPASLTSYDIPEPMEMADLNNDLRPDVLVAHGGWNALGIYLQGTSGTLDPELLDPIPYASHYNPHGLAVGDVNGDGAPDVAIADYNSGLVVLRHVPVANLPLRYHAVPPCRLLDTRTAARPLPANTYRTFTATGACGIPADARAVALNITAVNPGDVGDYRLYPAGTSIPPASTINFAAGRTRANNAIVSVGTGGAITVRCDMPAGSTASAHLAVDVSGFFR
jgi:hypothetical protein